MKHLRNLLVIIGILGGALIFQADPASAHNPNQYSYWSCGATRLDSQDFVTHSKPIDLAPGYLFSRCEATWYDGSHRKQWDSVMDDQGNASVWGTWHFCYLGEYCQPESQWP